MSETTQRPITSPKGTTGEVSLPHGRKVEFETLIEKLSPGGEFTKLAEGRAKDRDDALTRLLRPKKWHNIRR